jgi:acetyltransferase-like isoleucine patch superfamily enzyme
VFNIPSKVIETYVEPNHYKDNYFISVTTKLIYNNKMKLSTDWWIGSGTIFYNAHIGKSRN